MAKVRALRCCGPVEGDPADVAALVVEQFLGHFICPVIWRDRRREMKALEGLLKGFADFRLGYYHDHLDLFEKLATEGQSPKILIVGCADARVDPGILTQTKPGDIFTVRNIGAMVPPALDPPDNQQHGTSAAIEYAVRGLGVEHIVILGHALCGGIAALVDGDKGAFADFDYLSTWTGDRAGRARPRGRETEGPLEGRDRARGRAGRRRELGAESDELSVARREGEGRHARAARLVVQSHQGPALRLQSRRRWRSSRYWASRSSRRSARRRRSRRSRPERFIDAMAGRPPLVLMRRIVVVGSQGSGKTRLSLALGRKLGLPVIHLDVLYWRPGWKPSDTRVPRARRAGDRGRQLDRRRQLFRSLPWISPLARADRFMAIERPRWLCVWRVLWRSAFQTQRPAHRPARRLSRAVRLGSGEAGLALAPSERRPQIEAERLSSYGGHRSRSMRLRTDREIAAFARRASSRAT